MIKNPPEFTLGPGGELWSQSVGKWRCNAHGWRSGSRALSNRTGVGNSRSYGGRKSWQFDEKGTAEFGRIEVPQVQKIKLDLFLYGSKELMPGYLLLHLVLGTLALKWWIEVRIVEASKAYRRCPIFQTTDPHTFGASALAILSPEMRVKALSI